MIHIDLLRKVYVFEGFTDAELKQLAPIIHEKEYIEGDYIFEEGSEATSIHIIKTGTIEILKKGPSDDHKVATFSEHSHFGEMAFLDRAPRAASALARETCRLLEISYKDLENLMHSNADLAVKFYRNFAHALCRRMRHTTADLSALMELKLRQL